MTVKMQKESFTTWVRNNWYEIFDTAIAKKKYVLRLQVIFDILITAYNICTRNVYLM